MIVDHIAVRETVALDASVGLRRTGDGYLVASPRVARTGIQVYGGREVGRPDMDRVRVYRPEAEVFSKAAMQTIAHRPITNDHPPETVTADNWRKYAVGSVGGDVARDGDYIRVPMIVMDGLAIADIEDGKRELSLGYTADLEWRNGTTDSGEEFDAVQTKIRVNHLAIVDAARGGRKLVVGDQGPVDGRPEVETGSKGDRKMSDVTLKTITVDGISVEMTDTAAQVVAKRLGAMETEIKALKDQAAADAGGFAAFKKKKEEEEAEEKKKSEAKDAEIAALKQKVKDAEITPARLDEMVKDRSEVIVKAAAVLGDELVIEGKTEAEMRRQVVDKKLADVAKDWSDDQVRAAFAAFTADIDPNAAPTNDAAQNMAAGFSGKPATTVANLDAARKKYDERIANAWKGTAAQ